MPTGADYALYLSTPCICRSCERRPLRSGRLADRRRTGRAGDARRCRPAPAMAGRPLGRQAAAGAGGHGASVGQTWKFAAATGWRRGCRPRIRVGGQPLAGSLVDRAHRPRSVWRRWRSGIGRRSESIWSICRRRLAALTAASRRLRPVVVYAAGAVLDCGRSACGGRPRCGASKKRFTRPASGARPGRRGT